MCKKRKQTFRKINLWLLMSISFIVLIMSNVIASDVAYIYKKDYKIDNNIIDVFEDLGMTVDLIHESELPIDLSDYKLLFLGDERFDYYYKVKIGQIPTIIANYYYGEAWGITDRDGVSKLAATEPLNVQMTDARVKQVYTRARYPTNSISIPYYYLDKLNKAPNLERVAATYMRQSNDFGDVIAYAGAGTRLFNGKDTDSNLCFYGIIESDFWTDEARDLFIDCVGYTVIECFEDLDCPEGGVSEPYCGTDDNVYNDIEEPSCQNPGTVQSQCVKEGTPVLLETCDYGCESGVCLEPKQCQDNEDNDDDGLTDMEDPGCESPEDDDESDGTTECQDDIDNDSDGVIDEKDPGCWDDPEEPSTYNRLDDDESDATTKCQDEIDNDGDGFIDCEDPGCLLDENILSSCDPTDNSEDNIVCSEYIDCGVDDFLGNDVCQGDDLYDDFVTNVCNNPGTVNSYCSEGIQLLLKNDCGEDYCDSYGDSYCKDDDVYHSRTCYDNGCDTNACISTSSNDEEMIEECRYGCESGQCVNECSIDSDCSSDYYSDNYCSGKNVVKDFFDYSCNTGNCELDIKLETVEECADICIDGQCLDISCYQDSDCDDNDAFTLDECNHAGTINSYCSNVPINCLIDNDCGITGFIDDEFCSAEDLFKNYQESKCYNPGTQNSYCDVKITQTLLSDCGEDYCDSYGDTYCKGTDVYKQRTCYDNGCDTNACISLFDTEEVLVESCQHNCEAGSCTGECSVDSECPDDYYTNNYCSGKNLVRDYIDYSCSGSECSSTTTTETIEECADLCLVDECVDITCSADSECGADGYISDEFCKLGDVYRTYKDYTCLNPGTAASSCTSNNEDRKIQECDYGCSGGICYGECNQDSECGDDYYSDNYCSGKDVVKDFFDYSCSNHDCILDESTITVEVCDDSCFEGSCVDITCSADSECGTDGYIDDNFCKMDDVYRTYKDYTCLNPGTSSSSCTSSTEERLIEDCSYDCIDGSCTGECIHDSDCPDDIIGDNYCSGLDIVRDITDYSCIAFECSSELTTDTIETCSYQCSDGMCDGDCSVDSDCPDDSYTPNYCMGLDVKRDFNDYSCIGNDCTLQITTETIETCSIQCFNGECVGECRQNSDCPDDYYGENYCQGKNVVRDLFDYSCQGLNCILEESTEVLQECAYGCSNAQCIDVTCNIDSDCDDDDAYTYDECNLPGTSNSYCTNTPINCVVNNDCGITGYIQSEYCFNQNVYKNYQVSNCKNPGTPNSYCEIRISQTFLVDCGIDSCDPFELPYCKNGDVYKQRTCHDNGCEDGACISLLDIDERKVEDCQYGCSNGACTGECSIDSDCSEDFYSENYCSGKDVVKDFNDYSCVNNNCELDTSIITVEECSHACSDGACTGECTIDSDCGEDYYGDKYCSGTSVVRDLFDSYCSHNNCGLQIITETLEECAYQCSNGECIGECSVDSDCPDDYYSSNYCSGKNVVRDFFDYSCVGVFCNLDKTTETLEECADMCVDGSCVDITCSADSECGTDGYIGDNFCKMDDVYRTYKDYTCLNPGTASSSCTSSTEDRKQEDCAYDCVGGSCTGECLLDSDCPNDYYGDNYCKDDDVFKDLTDYSCVAFECKSSILPELVEECADVCVDGNCEDITCRSDSECGNDGFIGDRFCKMDDVYQTYKEYDCLNPGTPGSSCTSDTEDRKLEECSYGCSGGECIGECNLDSDCPNDYYGDNYCIGKNVVKDFFDYSCQGLFCNLETTTVTVEECADMCVDGSCVDITCSADSECGTDGYIGDNFCKMDDVYRTYKDYTCLNPGTASSSCTSSTEDRKQEDCAYDCVGGSCTGECLLDSDCPNDYYGDNYCKDDDVFKDLTDYSCVAFECKSSILPELVEECADVCVDGNCEDITCRSDSECGNDGFIGDNFCKMDDVYQTYKEYDCLNPGTPGSSCTSSTEDRKQEECSYGCSGGECIGVCNLDSDCPNDYYGSNYCSGDDVYRDLTDYSCQSHQCTSDVIPELVRECVDMCIDGSCIDYICSTDSDCGTDGFTGDLFCSSDDVFQFFKEYTCVNPATENSRCDLDVAPKLLEECADICVDGSCVDVTCSVDSDCGSDGYIGDKFCKMDDVYRKYKEYTCNSPGTQGSSCSDETSDKFIKECDFGCSGGSCIDLPECKDGIDNDNDGKIDALIEDTSTQCSEDGLIHIPAGNNLPNEKYYPKGTGGAIVRDVIDANPQILSDVPKIFKSGGEYYYNNYGDVRYLHPAYEGTSADMMCDVLGYNSYDSLYKHVFSSCNNDAVLYYNQNTGKWYVRLGCDAVYANKQLRCFNPKTVAGCSDGQDNDGDCLVDMDDPGCSSPSDNDERGASNAGIKCQDGIDNDNDGKSDYCFSDGSNSGICDKGCATPFDISEIMHDPQCTSPDDDSELIGPGEEICDNGIDDDGDGLIDGLNFDDCSNLPSQKSYPKGSGGAIIRDVIDTNQNILTDVPKIFKSGGAYYYNNNGDVRYLHPAYEGTSADKMCEVLGYNSYDSLYKHVFSSCNNDAVLYYNSQTDNWYVRLGCDAVYGNKQLRCFDPFCITACNDGIDNDGDGLKDMNDPGCESQFDDSEFTHDPDCI